MTTLKITVDDEQAETLKDMLMPIDLVKSIEEQETPAAIAQEPETPHERLIWIQKEIGDKQLFKEIEYPSAWQREIRKDRDRDF